MVNNKNVYEFEIGGNLLLMHRFNGLQEEKKIKELPKRELAEKHAYMEDDGELYAPSEWLRGALIGAFISRAGNKEMTKTKVKVSPRVMILPARLPLGTKKYEIDVRSAPAGNMSRGGTRDMCIRPLVQNWSLKGQIVSSLDMDEKDMKLMLEIAGEDIGIGSNRMNGFGRFTVTSFKKVVD